MSTLSMCKLFYTMLSNRSNSRSNIWNVAYQFRKFHLDDYNENSDRFWHVKRLALMKVWLSQFLGISITVSITVINFVVASPKIHLIDETLFHWKCVLYINDRQSMFQEPLHNCNFNRTSIASQHNIQTEQEYLTKIVYLIRNSTYIHI